MTKRQAGPKVRAGPIAERLDAAGFNLTVAEAAAIAAAAVEFRLLEEVVYRVKPSRDVERLRSFAGAAAALVVALDALQDTSEMSELRAKLREVYGPAAHRDMDTAYAVMVSAGLAARGLSAAAGFPVGRRGKTQPNWAAHAWARCALKHWRAAGLTYGKGFSPTGRFPQALAAATRLHGVPNASDRDVLRKALGHAEGAAS